LGEGNTPLTAIEFQGDQVYLKNEGLNPSGSYKDRGAAVIMSIIAAHGIRKVVEDSSGNAGAALAAYAARAGIQASIYVPTAASGPKREQIHAYGAELVQVDGPRSAAAEAVWRAYEEGEVYASHVYLPHGLAGYATIAFEIFEQLGKSPGTVILPVGHGLLFMGVYMGFEALHSAGQIQAMPRMIGVQAAACAPIWAEFIKGNQPEIPADERSTIAEGIRIAQPVHRSMVLEIIRQTNGTMIAVHEEEITRGRNELASRGFFIEPTSAVVWDALRQIHAEAEQPQVAILSGSGYKSRQ
jgi:threonine synthase